MMPKQWATEVVFIGIWLSAFAQWGTDGTSVEFNSYQGDLRSGSYISMDTENLDMNNLEISFEFRALSRDSPLLYIAGEDHFVVLELISNITTGRMYFQIKLIRGRAGSGYTTVERDPDTEWNNVTLSINRTNFAVTFNKEEIQETLWTPIRLGGRIYFGSPRLLDLAHIKKSIFSGCLRDVVVNNKWVLDEFLVDSTTYRYEGNIRRGCSLPTETVTFSGQDSYVWYNLSAPANNRSRVNIDFKTFDTDFSLFALDFGETGNISVSVRRGRILRVQQWRYGISQQQQFDTGVAQGDGNLRSIEFSLNETNLELRMGDFVAGRMLFTGPTWRDVNQKYYLYLGGYPYSEGFEGCMKGVSFTSGFKIVSDLQEQDHVLNGAKFGECKVYDRCNPNPCRSGSCTRIRGNFICNCTNTGYMGAVCHTPLYPQSCSFVSFPLGANAVEATIDVDGSGPLLPTDVYCSNQDGFTVSVPSGMNNSFALVDGFQDPGSFRGTVSYFGIAEKELVGIIDRSTSCRQFIEYKCRNSRLLLTPANSQTPYGFWVGRNNQEHYYWGGADAETGGCLCKQTEGCINGGTCNCNSGQSTSDKGYVTQMADLPIRQVRFGDTGTVADDKTGQYYIGPLTCSGDSGITNVVTFSRLNSTIKLDRRLYSAPITIWFQFKTLKSRSTLLYASGARNKNYLVIRIEGPTQLYVQLMHDVPARSLLWALPFRLNDNKWHSVYFEFNSKEAVIHIDNRTTKVVAFDQWVEERELMTDSPMILGGNEDGSNQFLGCFRGLRINGDMVNLRKLVEDKLTDKGILEGCISPCYSNPCLNSGSCMNKFYATFMCDCEASAFSGCYCGKAVGASMESNSSMEFYTRRGFQPETPKEIELSFRTNDYNSRRYLFQVMSQLNEFLSILVVSGKVKIELNYGSGYRNVTSPVVVGDGEPHSVKVTVDTVNSQLLLMVDQTESSLIFPVRDTSFGRVMSMTIGSLDLNNPGIEGCVFGIRYNELPLLKYALDQPQPNYVVRKGRITPNSCMIPEAMPAIALKQNAPTSSNFGFESRMPAFIQSVTTINEADGQVKVASEVYPGEITQLSCNGKGFPIPRYDWTLNGDEVPCPHLVEDNQVLLLPEELMEGSYQCFASNKWGLSKSDFISVDSAEVGPAPQMQSETRTIQAGSFVRLFCHNKVLSKPKAEVFWLDQYASDRIFESPNGDLNFLWVTPEDSKTYTCGVRNPTLNLYRTIRSITLIVLPVDISFLQQPKLVFADGPKEPVALGDTANFECIVSGQPVPRQRWLYPNFQGDVSSIKRDPYGRLLSITNVSEKHKGPFECLIGNRSMRNFTYNITSKPIWVEQLGETLVYENSDMELKCLSRSLPGDQPPDTPQWFVNGTELMNLNQLPDPNRYVFNGNRTTLRVKQVTKQDIQTFQCKVSNNIGYSLSSGYLNVLDPMQVVQKPRDVSVERGRMAVFEVRVQADPAADVYFTWERNQMGVMPFFEQNVRRTELEKAVFVENSQMSSTFSINTEEIQDDDLVHFEGTYMCAVSDGVSQEMTEVTLKIRPALAAGSLTRNQTIGVIIGCVCGALLIVVLITLFCCLLRNKKTKQADITSYKNPSFTH